MVETASKGFPCRACRCVLLRTSSGCRESISRGAFDQPKTAAIGSDCHGHAASDDLSVQIHTYCRYLLSRVSVMSVQVVVMKVVWWCCCLEPPVLSAHTILCRNTRRVAPTVRASALRAPAEMTHSRHRVGVRSPSPRGVANLCVTM